MTPLSAFITFACYSRNSIANMSKKQKQSPKILSPENYIRQRARNLPFFKCYVNEEWEDHGLAHVTIARNHVNGNITFCSYLVDLKCLGIKDTFYQFNVPEYEFDEYKEKLNLRLDLIECDYILAHNIVYAGWVYAEDIGLQPHKDFQSVTRYMLEEDTNEIPLYDITTGGDGGKPVYIQGAFEDDAMAKMILNRLEKKLGPGNFDYVLSVDDPLYDDSYDENEDDEEEVGFDEEIGDDPETLYRNEYSRNSFKENVEIFLGLTQYLDHDEEDVDMSNFDWFDEGGRGTEENFDRILALTNILYDDLTNLKEINSWLTKWRNEVQDYSITNAAYWQMLGLQNEEDITYEDLSYLTKEEDEEKFREYVRERWGEGPYVAFHELQTSSDNLKKKKTKIKKVLEKYPVYALLKLEEKTIRIEENKLKKSELSYKSSFGDRKEITPYEYVKWQVVRLHYFLSTGDLMGVEAMTLFNDPEMYDEHSKIGQFIAVLYAVRISLMRTYFLQ